jgi:hypothetical protein
MDHETVASVMTSLMRSERLWRASAMRATRGQYLGNLRRASELALAIEDIAPCAFADGHAEVDIESNLCDAHARILLVFGEQVGVVVSMVVVRVARMAAGLRLRLGGGHGKRGSVLCAVGSGGPIKSPSRRG